MCTCLTGMPPQAVWGLLGVGGKGCGVEGGGVGVMIQIQVGVQQMS